MRAGKIKKWADNNLISQEQAEAIVRFEKSSASWQGGLVVFLGIVVVALGCSATIAANWEFTPAWLKLSGNGLLLLATGYFCWRFHSRGNYLAFEFLLLFFLLYLLASIGLIGQIFHISAPYHEALGLWCLMSVGLFLASKRLPVPVFWLIGLGAVFFSFTLHKYDETWAVGWLPHIIGGYALLAIIFTYIFGRNSPQARAAALIFTILLLAAAFCSEFAEARAWYNQTENGRLWVVALLLLSLALLWFSRHFNLWQKMALSLGGLWCIAFIYQLFFCLSFRIHSFFQGSEYHWYNDWLTDPVSSFTLLAWLAFYAVASNYRRLFLLWLFLAGIRICAIFLLASYGLMQTGLALLVSGALLVSLPLLWKRFLIKKLFRVSQPDDNRQEAGHE